MDSNKLMLNADKTSRVEQLDCDAIKILDTDISLQNSVKYLGLRIDQTLSMSDHISDVCRSSFFIFEAYWLHSPLLDWKSDCLSY